MNNIPTQYKNINFRSRLEAKWAAYFDLCQWNWQYEPCDFNGWIPDFVIIGQKNNVFVEVKPISKINNSIDKVLNSDVNSEVLILGLTNLITNEFDELLLGWLYEIYDGSILGESYAAHGKWEAGLGKLGFCSDSMSYEDRITGGYDGGCFGSYRQDRQEIENEIKSKWNHATNIVQWKK